MGFGMGGVIGAKLASPGTPAVAVCGDGCFLMHANAVALHYAYYNFAKVHQTLRVTPAMEAGIADRVWSIDEIVTLLD